MTNVYMHVYNIVCFAWPCFDGSRGPGRQDGLFCLAP